MPQTMHDIRLTDRLNVRRTNRRAQPAQPTTEPSARALSIVHTGHSLHLVNGSGRTLCGRGNFDERDYYDTPESALRVWHDPRQDRCTTCLRRGGSEIASQALAA